MKIVVLGAKGLWGSAIIRYWNRFGSERDTLFPFDLPDFDICSRFFVQDLLREASPDVIINAVGSGQIDWMESHPQRALHFHVHGTEYVRDAAKKQGAFLVHLSCGEVFYRETPSISLNKEEDDPASCSIFAKTKWAGEQAAREYDRSLIVRTSAPFGVSGANSGCGNIVETLINVLHRARSVRVLNDVRISPIFVFEAVRALHYLVHRNEKGLFHLAGPDTATPMEIADYLLKKCFSEDLVKNTGKRSPELIPIIWNEYGIEAPRSYNTSLDSEKYFLLENAPSISSWKDAINDFLEIRQPFLQFLDPAY